MPFEVLFESLAEAKLKGIFSVFCTAYPGLRTGSFLVMNSNAEKSPFSTYFLSFKSSKEIVSVFYTAYVLFLS